jgi:4-amino-4-deoxy-L-arabinose transferase-like glycosyltransferase
MTLTARLLVLCLLLFFFGRLMGAAGAMSATFDEPVHIFQGALYWQHRPLRPVVENPPLVNAIIGLPVTLALRPNLPLDHPLWPTSDWEGLGQVFLWQVNDNGRQLIFAGRLSIMLLALLLGALLYRWSRDLAGSQWPGLAALLLYTFDPNVLAHSHLASTDLGVTFFFFLAAFLVWRYWRALDDGRYRDPEKSLPGLGDRGIKPGQEIPLSANPGGKKYSGHLYLAAAAALGCALAAKFSAIILLPALLLLSAGRLIWMRESERGWRRTAVELAGWFLIAGLIFLAIYRFNFDTLLADFNGQRVHQLTGHSAFLLGEISQSGWWYYFPVIFAIKTPIPVLVLLAASLVALIGQIVTGKWQFTTHNSQFKIHNSPPLLPNVADWLWPLLLAGGIGAAGLVSRVNIGYRYLLPALPLLYLLTSQLARPGYRRRAWVQWGTGVFIAAAVVGSLATHPHYLAYFNAIVGGRAQGWRYAADSNIDWGQDMQALGDYMAARQIPSVYLSWHGMGLPAAYGVSAIPLTARTAALGDEPWPAFYPDWPAPGVYVLSVTQLHGVYLPDPTYFRWFQQRPPDDKVGSSLFVYQVPAEGAPAQLALSGIALSAITPADFQQTFAGNDARPRWYDARSSLLWPAGAGSRWTAVGDGHLPRHPALQAFYPAAPALTGENSDGWRYHLYQWPEPPLAARAGRLQRAYWLPEGSALPPQQTPALFADSWLLLGYELIETQPYQPGELLELLTYWQVVEGTPMALSIFVHLLDADGQIVAQHDGLDIAAEWARPGDELAQLHTIHLPQGLPPGLYTVQIGLYERHSLERWPAATAVGSSDRLWLQPIQITD